MASAGLLASVTAIGMPPRITRRPGLRGASLSGVEEEGVGRSCVIVFIFIDEA
jgi:hypothetical protein